MDLKEGELKEGIKGKNVKNHEKGIKIFDLISYVVSPDMAEKDAIVHFV